MGNSRSLTALHTAVALCAHYAGDDGAALELALEDLRRYWERGWGAGTFRLLDEGETLPAADLIVLVGAGDTLPAIAALERKDKLSPAKPQAEGYALDTFADDGQRLAVLRAWDRLGRQYAVYALASQDEYSRLKPGFAEDYPCEVQPATMQALARALAACQAEPERMRGLDVCALVDGAEGE